MKKLQAIAYMTIGAVAAFAVTSTTQVIAKSGTVSTQLTYRNIGVVIDGVPTTLTDLEGRTQEPFIAFDTVYVPLSAMARALGKTSQWEQSTATIYIGSSGQTASNTKEVPLYNMPYLEIGDGSGYDVMQAGTDNYIRISSDTGSVSNGRKTCSNYAVYPIDMMATKFTAILNPPYDNKANPELVYKIYGDGQLLFTSPIFTPITAPQPISLNVSGFSKLKIETTLTYTNTYVSYSWGVGNGQWKGIQNAVFVVPN